MHFRGTWSTGTHSPLVEESLIDAAHAILSERGQDASKRAANSSAYLRPAWWSVEAAAVTSPGDGPPGATPPTATTPAAGATSTERRPALPAGALDAAVVQSLLAAYQDTDPFANAVVETHGRAQLGHARHEGELAALAADLAEVDTGIDRYVRAFETGAMPEAICGTRVKALDSQSMALRAHREVLSDEMDEADLTAPSPEELSALRDRVAEALASGDPAPVKTLLQALIHEIRVDTAERPSTRSSVFHWAGTTLGTMRFAHCPGRWSLSGLTRTRLSRGNTSVTCGNRLRRHSR